MHVFRRRLVGRQQAALHLNRSEHRDPSGTGSFYEYSQHRTLRLASSHLHIHCHSTYHESITFSSILGPVHEVEPKAQDRKLV